MALLILVLGLIPVASARADKMSKEDKAWLDSVRSLALQEEEKAFKDLKEKSDREEFKQIFWKRRDPDLETAENEWKPEFDKALAEADRRYKAAGRAGSQTDCGHVFILLGEPNELKKDKDPDAPAVGRVPETWIYNDQRGKATIAFDESCQVPQGVDLNKALDREAERKIVHPEINYRTGADQHIVKLAEQLPKPTPGRALLREPRQDFATALDPALVIRGQSGGSYVGLIVRGDAKALGLEAGKSATLVLAAQATLESGKVATSSERESVVVASADGSFLTSAGVTLKPGKYTLSVAVLNAGSGKGSVATLAYDVPSFSSGEVTASVPMLLPGELAEMPPQSEPDPKDAWFAFTIGKAQMRPHFANAFALSDSIQLLAVIYGAQTDPATGKAQVGATFTIMKDGKRVTGSQEDVFETADATAGAGPFKLSDMGMSAGKYVLQLRVVDKLAGKELKRETPFEVK
jgi:GWxTD domain-containing protein